MAACRPGDSSPWLPAHPTMHPTLRSGDTVQPASGLLSGHSQITTNRDRPACCHHCCPPCTACRHLPTCPRPPPPRPPAQASQLQSLVLRCSHATVYAATESMESLSKLAALTSLRMGPNPEDIFPHSSPLGFPRLPSFLASLGRLQQIDICMADSATVASLSGLDFTPLQHIPDVKITLRADTSIRAVAHLPTSLSLITGLTKLTVQVSWDRQHDSYPGFELSHPAHVAAAAAAAVETSIPATRAACATNSP